MRTVNPSAEVLLCLIAVTDPLLHNKLVLILCAFKSVMV